MEKIEIPLLVLLGTILPLASLHAEPILREPHTAYPSDFDTQIRATIPSPTQGWMRQSQKGDAGILLGGQQVEILAVGKTLLRVRGQARHGQVAAWIPHNAVTNLPEGFLKNIFLAEDRRTNVDALIARNEVAIGMTKNEVERSLGRPQRKTKRATSSGTSETWEYIRYRVVPQAVQTGGGTLISGRPSGCLYLWTQPWYPGGLWLQIPDGNLSVQFDNQLVCELNQTEGTPPISGGRPKIRVEPLTVNLGP